MTETRELRLEALLGREVYGANNRQVGRVEEFRAERHGRGCVLTGVVIGFPGLMERLGLGVRALFGIGRRGCVARWDQIDISNPRKLHLNCPIDELEQL
jgi:hypothetical protein